MTAEQLGLWGSAVRPRSPRSPRTSPPKKSEPLNNLGPENPSAQLPMYMTPKEILTHFQPTDGDRINVTRQTTHDNVFQRKETHGEMMNRKLDEANRGGITKSIKKHGVVDPIQLQASEKQWNVGELGKYQIMDGNHRLAAAHSLNPDGLVPVEHHDYAYEAHELGLQRRAKRVAAARARQEEAGKRQGVANLLAAMQGR